MAVVFNRGKGAVAELARQDPTKFGVLLLQQAQPDGDIVNHEDVDALLSPAGNEEADFTNYSRLTGITATVVQDDTNNRVDVDMPNPTWENAGNGTNNQLAKLVTFYDTDAGADVDLLCLTAHDFAAETDGQNLTGSLPSQGFYRAS